MNQDSLSSKAWLNLGIFTTLLLGSVWWIQSPLISSRPRDPQTTKLIETSFPSEKSYSRAWQDPFEPHFDKVNLNGKQVDCKILKATFKKDFESQFSMTTSTNRQNKLLLIGVMVPGGPFEDRTERRQRIRVAMASAMGAGGYAPVDSEHLGSFPFDRQEALDATAKPSERKDDPLYLHHESYFDSFQYDILKILDMPVVSLERKSGAFHAHNGLYTNSFSPDRQESPDISETPPKKKSEHFHIPYEWFTKLSDNERRVLSYDSAYDRILVFWIPDDQFAESPIKLLHGLRTQVDDAIGDCTLRCNVFRKADFRIFGPWSSTTLKKMLEEADGIKASCKACSTQACCNGANCDKACCIKWQIRDSKLAFYNVFATASLQTLLENSSAKSLKNGCAIISDKLSFLRTPEATCYHNISCSKNKWKTRKEADVFYYTTCPDTELALAMKGELGRRGIDVSKKRIALIAENDTVYGRSLPKTFRQTFKEGKSDNIVRYTYLRGLDGRIPQEVTKTASSPEFVGGFWFR